MTEPGRTSNASRDVDATVREAFRDDLPTGLGGRLEEQVRGFAAARQAREIRFLPGMEGLRRDWAAGRVALGIVSALVVACGVALHATTGPTAFPDSLARLNRSVSLYQAFLRAPVDSCSGELGGPADTPAELAERVYRRWVYVRSERVAGDGMKLVFRDPGLTTSYELILEKDGFLPREIRRVGAAGLGMRCTEDKPRADEGSRSEGGGR